jgi:Glycosyl hydrolase catalytic core
MLTKWLCFAVLSLKATFALSRGVTPSTKRGLIDIATQNPSDDKIWIRKGSDLTWYYNYQAEPSPAYASDASFEFVPMLFGKPDQLTSADTPFLTSIQNQIEAGAKIAYVLAYNEPDGQSSTGGSGISADTAASVWMRNIAPLRDLGIRAGLPAVTGSPNGLKWLASFNRSCLALNSKGCEADFIPVHWYGNFQGMVSHVDQVRATFPKIPIWVTEFADPNDTLLSSQSFYNQSTAFLDQLHYCDRYSYFGSFRSDVSNIGPNAAFLSQKGQLTDIGSWYLGGSATGNVPSGAAGARLQLSIFAWAHMCLITLFLVI